MSPDFDIDSDFIASIPERKEKIRDEISKMIVGQQEIIDELLITLFCDTHSILVGVPGLAKTRLVRNLARALDLEFNRIQFTPDLMPSDITGTDILKESEGERYFEFQKGPVFTDVLLADEINRAPPKTQSALLQSMQERQVTAGGSTYDFSLPFMVLATQNPIEQEGTYPLPEAQLDRFMFFIKVNYPSADEEQEIVNMTTGRPPEKIEPVINREEILKIQKAVKNVPVAEDLVKETVKLVRQTRPGCSQDLDFIDRWLRWGASPRASQFLIMAGKAKTLLEGRSHVTREDIKQLAPLSLRHRLVLSFAAESENIDRDEILDRLLQNWP
ncbi:MAG: AAA family ATPase [bacterium]